MFKIILTIGTIQALAVGIQFIKSKLVAVYLGPAGVGVVGTIDQFVQLAAYASALSLPAASLKFLSKSHSEGHEAFAASYAGFFKLLLLLSAAGMLLTVGAVLLKPGLFGAEMENYQLPLALGLLTLPAFTLTTFFINVLAAAQKYKASSLLVVVINAATTIAVVGGVLIAGMLGLYLGSLFAGVALTIGAMVYFREKLALPLYDRRTKILEKLRRSPDISALALMLYFGAIAASLAYLIARYSTLKTFGEIDAGLLHALIALSLALGMALNPAINLYLTPIVSRNLEKPLKVRHSIQFQRKIALIMSLAALPIVMFPRLMLTLMFSAKFAEAGHLVFLFVVSQFILQLAGVHQALLIGVDDAKTYTAITTSGQLIFALLCLLLIPHFGIKGAAFGQLAANSYIFGLTFYRLKQKHGYAPPFNSGLLVGYTLCVLLTAGAFSSRGAELEIPVVASKILFLFAFGGSLLLFTNKEERAYLGGLRNKFWQRLNAGQ